MYASSFGVVEFPIFTVYIANKVILLHLLVVCLQRANAWVRMRRPFLLTAQVYIPCVCFSGSRWIALSFRRPGNCYTKKRRKRKEKKKRLIIK